MNSPFFWELAILIFILGVILLPALLGIFVFKQIPVRVVHKDSGMTKTARLGWSWTYWYFGFLVPVFRGEVLIGVLHLVISLFTFGLFQLIVSFLYNRQQLTRLLEKGWVLPETEQYARRELGIQTTTVRTEPNLYQ